MLAGLTGDRDAAEHARDFFDARIVLERRHLSSRRASIGHLRDTKVLNTEGRDLRQVRDAKHLSCRAERGELAADDFGDRAAHSGIYFIEHHAAASAEVFDATGERHLHGE